MLQHPDLDDHLVSALYRFCQVLKGAEDVFANEVVAPIIEDMRIFGEEGIEKYLRVEKRDDEG